MRRLLGGCGAAGTDPDGTTNNVMFRAGKVAESVAPETLVSVSSSHRLARGQLKNPPCAIRETKPMTVKKSA